MNKEDYKTLKAIVEKLPVEKKAEALAIIERNKPKKKINKYQQILDGLNKMSQLPSGYNEGPM